MPDIYSFQNDKQESAVFSDYVIEPGLFAHLRDALSERAAEKKQTVALLAMIREAKKEGVFFKAGREERSEAPAVMMAKNWLATLHPPQSYAALSGAAKHKAVARFNERGLRNASWPDRRDARELPDLPARSDKEEAVVRALPLRYKAPVSFSQNPKKFDTFDQPSALEIQASAKWLPRISAQFDLAQAEWDQAQLARPNNPFAKKIAAYQLGQMAARSLAPALLSGSLWVCGSETHKGFSFIVNRGNLNPDARYARSFATQKEASEWGAERGATHVLELGWKPLSRAAIGNAEPSETLETLFSLKEAQELSEITQPSPPPEPSGDESSPEPAPPRRRAVL